MEKVIKCAHLIHLISTPTNAHIYKFYTKTFKTGPTCFDPILYYIILYYIILYYICVQNSINTILSNLTTLF